jgi:hypothetical protein
VLGRGLLGNLIRGHHLPSAAAAQGLALTSIICILARLCRVGAVAQTLHVIGLEGLEDEILSTGCQASALCKEVVWWALLALMCNANLNTFPF